MVKVSLFFALGVWLLQQQAALPASPGPWLIACVLALAILLLWAPRRKMPRNALLAMLVVAAGFSYAGYRAQARMADALPPAWEGKNIELTGVVAGLPRERIQGQSFVFDVENVLTPGAHVPAHILLSTYDRRPAARVKAGERWRFTVRLKRPHGTSNPYGFDFESWMLERNLRAVGYVRTRAHNIRLAARVDAPSYLIARMREDIRARFRRVLGNAPYTGILVALAIGDHSGIPNAQWQIFTRTGTSHLMAISGLHIALFATFAFALVYAVWRRVPRLALALPARKAAAIAALLAAFAYALLSGFSIPAQRAVYMLAAVSVALVFSRRIPPAQLLAGALLAVLLADPWAVEAAGFWLSFGAVALILFIGANRLGKAHWLAEYGRVQWAMLAGMVPALLVLFQQVSLVAPIANAFAIPVVSFVVAPLAVLSAVLPIDALLSLAHAVMSACMGLLGWLSNLPDAVWQQHAPAGWSIALGLAGALWMLLPRGFPARWLGALMLLPMFLVFPPVPAPGSLHMVVFDVGQGLSVAVRTRHHALLYDTGPDYPGPADAGNRILVPSLRAQGVARLDTLILTHNDADHTGGALSVLHALPVGWMLSSLPYASPIVRQGPFDQRCADGQAWDWDGVHFAMLHPARASYGNARIKKNDRGCTLRISVGRNSILLAADIEKKSERRLLRVHPDKLAATLLVVPHHGSSTSSTRPFVRAVHPRYAVFAVGYRNRFHHPRPAVVRRYREQGSILLRSDRDGAVVVDMDGRTLHLQRWREAHHRYWQQ